MSLLDLCDSDVAAIRVESNAADAIRMMLDRHVGAVGIVDSEGLVAGIFTERDVLPELLPLPVATPRRRRFED